MARKLSEILEEMANAFRGSKTRQEWAGSTKEAAQATMTGLRGFGAETLTSTAEKFNQALPYIERAGYDVTEIQVGIGLSPRLIADLRVREQISEEARAELLGEVAERRLISTILSSLFKAADAREKLQFKKFQFASLELELSIMPVVSLRFLPAPRGALVDDEQALTAAEPIDGETPSDI